MELTEREKVICQFVIDWSGGMKWDDFQKKYPSIAGQRTSLGVLLPMWIRLGCQVNKGA